MAISLSADEVVQMPLDALALRILRDVDETDEWNSYIWMNTQQQSPEFSRRSDALRAFEEAWAWLRAPCRCRGCNRDKGTWRMPGEAYRRIRPS
jgi:hypothetical protein